MKENIEQLERGDLLWVSFGYEIHRAVYLGRDIAKIRYYGFSVDLKTHWWAYRRDRFLNWLKKKFS